MPLITYLYYWALALHGVEEDNGNALVYQGDNSIFQRPQSIIFFGFLFGGRVLSSRVNYSTSFLIMHYCI